MIPERPPTEPGDGRRLRPGAGQGWPRWGTWLVIAVILGLFLAGSLLSGGASNKISYSQFLSRVRGGQVESVTVDNSSNSISGVDKNGEHFKATGPSTIPDTDLDLLQRSGVKYDFKTSQPSFLLSVIPYLLPLLLLVGFFVWMNRRAQGQMGSIMQIGRSKA